MKDLTTENSNSSTVNKGEASTQNPPGDGYTSTRTYVVRVTTEDSNDFFVEVKASLLRKIRGKVKPLIFPQFPWWELLLAVSSITFGVFGSAIITALSLANDNSVRKPLIISSIVFLIIACVTFTSYLFIKHFNTVSLSVLANDLLIEIPDPDETIEKGLNQIIKTLKQSSKELLSDDGGAKL